jgi:hypothetical protein
VSIINPQRCASGYLQEEEKMSEVQRIHLLEPFATAISHYTDGVRGDHTPWVAGMLVTDAAGLGRME